MQGKEDLEIQNLIDPQYTNVWKNLIDKNRQLVNWSMQLASFNTKFGGSSMSAQTG